MVIGEENRTFLKCLWGSRFAYKWREEEEVSHCQSLDFGRWRLDLDLDLDLALKTNPNPVVPFGLFTGQDEMCNFSKLQPR